MQVPAAWLASLNITVCFNNTLATSVLTAAQKHGDPQAAAVNTWWVHFNWPNFPIAATI